LNLVDDNCYNVEILKSDVDSHVLKLNTEIRSTDKERNFDEEGAILYNELIIAAMENLSALETKQILLQQQHHVLSLKLYTIHQCKVFEEKGRKKTEDQLLLEERIKAIGEVLLDRGITNFSPEQT